MGRNHELEGEPTPWSRAGTVRLAGLLRYLPAPPGCLFSLSSSEHQALFCLDACMQLYSGRRVSPSLLLRMLLLLCCCCCCCAAAAAVLLLLLCCCCCCCCAAAAVAKRFCPAWGLLFCCIVVCLWSFSPPCILAAVPARVFASRINGRAAVARTSRTRHGYEGLE